MLSFINWKTLRRRLLRRHSREERSDIAAAGVRRREKSRGHPCVKATPHKSTGKSGDGVVKARGDRRGELELARELFVWDLCFSC